MYATVIRMQRLKLARDRANQLLIQISDNQILVEKSEPRADHVSNADQEPS